MHPAYTAAPTLAGGVTQAMYHGYAEQAVLIFVNKNSYKQTWISWGDLYYGQEWSKSLRLCSKVQILLKAPSM